MVVAFFRNLLLRQASIQKLLYQTCEDVPECVREPAAQIHELLRQAFFVDVFAEDDIQSTVPFTCKLPLPSPSGRDTMLDTFLVMYFRNVPLYAENYSVSFWVHLPIPTALVTHPSLVGTSDRKRVQFDFLTPRADNEKCKWSVTLVSNGRVIPTLGEPSRTDEDNLWHASFSLEESSQHQAIQCRERSVPEQGVFVVMHGSHVESDTWVALGGIRLI